MFLFASRIKGHTNVLLRHVRSGHCDGSDTTVDHASRLHVVNLYISGAHGIISAQSVSFYLIPFL